MSVEPVGNGEGLTRARLARLIDHTLLKPFASEDELRVLCDEALRHHFATVAINPVWVSYCSGRLTGTGVGIDAAIGFPLGANTAHVKVEEAREAVRAGATEIDMVINIGALKSGFADYVEREIAAVVKASSPAPVKVILETCYLTLDEKISVCEMSVRAGAAFVKTSTGFGKAGATVEDIELMRRVVGDKMGVKAAGGVRSYAEALAMIEAGATRIGTSAGIAILKEMPEAQM
ncbi:MAG: deoxyribose-phosphate aldolase [FCB group bacterium]|nr:deoxyribose-phosphate aldolase [FCB group bacterium]